MAQHKLTQRHNLLDPQTGHLIEAGYSNEYLLEYNKEAIRPGRRPKEWEYFLALTKDYGVGLTLAGVGVGSMFTVQLISLEEDYHICKSRMKPGDLGMPANINDSVSFEAGEDWCRYEKKENICRVTFSMKEFGPNGQTINGDVTFVTPASDKMVLAVPYEDPELFYYNYKVNCMPVTGCVTCGDQTFGFDGPCRAVGTQDWGRGIWEPVNQWYWGSASGYIDGKPFGFNIGHGFGDTSRATENMVFYDGVCHKLEDVTFLIPGDTIGDLRLILPDENYRMPWRFVSGDRRLELDFKPIHDRTSGEQKGEYYSTQHQVFGLFNGQVVLDDGRIVEVKDFLGFAEKVGNDWRGL